MILKFEKSFEKLFADYQKMMHGMRKTNIVLNDREAELELITNWGLQRTENIEGNRKNISTWDYSFQDEMK